MDVSVGILGPVQVLVDGVDVTPAAAKERALLALLAVRHPHVVAAERLTDELWPELPAEKARHVLQVRVATLRKRLGATGADAVVERAAPGYRLALPRHAIDAHRFSSMVDRARAETIAGTAPAAVVSTLADALRLWRGDPLADVQTATTLEAEAARLAEARFGAVEAWIDAGLACGRHESLLPELDALVAVHPLRERLSAQRILALYRCGRQAEALRACASIRRRLVDELGVEPGPALRALEVAVLEQRHELDTSPEAPAPGGSRAWRDATAVVRSGIRYAKTRDGVNIAYEVAGEGPLDVLVVPGYISHLDNWWDAWSGRLVRRLASFARLIIFDKRGMGLSDRPTEVDVEDWVEDARSVMDAVGAPTAAVLGVSAGCHIAALFAATHPERTSSLVLYGGTARVLPDDDYPFGLPIEAHEGFWARTEERWGTGYGINLWCPSAQQHPEVRAHFGKHQRMSASPGSGVAYLRAVTHMDVRHALPLVSAPTLVLHAARDRTVPIEMARYMAERIPDATLVELDSADHLIWFSDAIDVMTDEIQDFLTGSSPSGELGRRLATVVCAEVRAPAPAVGRAAVGHATVTARALRLVERYRGRAHASPTGRILATFDGPARAVRCATAIVADLEAEAITAWAGVHSGECDLVGQAVGGVAVRIAEQVADLAAPGEVLVSQAVADLVLGSSIAFGDVTSHPLPGVPGEWRVRAVAAT